MNRIDGGAAKHLSPPRCGNNGMGSHSTAPTAGYSSRAGGAYPADARNRDERRGESIGSCLPGNQANLSPRSAYDVNHLPPATVAPAVAASPSRAADAASGATTDGNQDALWTKFRQAVVEFAKPLLRGARRRPCIVLAFPAP
jgi:hypothetical protein